tara:strand:- start:873 stop:1376 length:504 start_codon:yes stop_codon:yes gene_type:complete
MEENMVLADFYDKARQTISGLLDIIRQEVYPAMNRVPECDQWVIDSAMFEEGELRDDIAKGLTPERYKPRNSHSVANETYRERRRLDIVKMVEGMNKHWEEDAAYPNPTYKIGWLADEIRIPYPEGCYPITQVKAESTPFVLVDGWIRPASDTESQVIWTRIEEVSE